MPPPRLSFIFLAWLTVALCASARAETFLTISGDVGDPVMRGRSARYESPTAELTCESHRMPGKVSITARARTGSAPPIRIDLGLPFGAPLRQGGKYSAIIDYGWSFPRPETSNMLVETNDHGYEQLTGTAEFEVKKLMLDSDLDVVSLWIVFRQRVDGAAGELRGEFKWHTEASGFRFNVPPVARLVSRPRAAAGVPTRLVAEAFDDDLPGTGAIQGAMGRQVRRPRDADGRRHLDADAHRRRRGQLRPHPDAE